MQIKKITGAQAVIESLLKENVEVIFGYPGGGIMPIYDALFDYQNKIEHILTRHEQAAAHAAEGYAKMTGTPGVCFATSGPGATNLVTGIADAQLDSVPLVCVTGQVPLSVLGTQAFQEVDIVAITKSVTKWNIQVQRAEDIAPSIAKAFQIAQSGRPGPVLVDITKNAQAEICYFSYEKARPTPLPKINKTQLKKAAALINNAKRPLLIVGNGVRIARAEEEVCKLAGRADIPVASTLLGLSSYQCHKNLNVGLLGMHGNYSPNKLTNEADVIVAVGMRFGDRVTGEVTRYAKQAKIIHVDIDTTQLNRIVPVELAVNADAKTFLEAFNLLIKRNSHTEWIQAFRDLDKEEDEQVMQPEINPKSGALRMAEVVKMLSDLTRGEAVIVADVGQHQMAAARYYKFTKPKSFVTSGGLGTMGFALPAAIGAKKAEPKREVIAIVGDGGMQMNLQELGTIMQEKLPVKVIVLNNNHLGLVRQWQEMFFDKRYSYVDLTNPDFVKVANSYNIAGLSVSDRSELASALKKMLVADKPFVLNVNVTKDENVFPMIPTGSSVDEIRLR